MGNGEWGLGTCGKRTRALATTQVRTASANREIRHGRGMEYDYMSKLELDLSSGSD